MYTGIAMKSPEPQPAAPRESSRKRLLVIDDDVELGDLVAQFLEREGLEAEFVHDGARGLEAALAGTWQAIVLDVMLPGMGGFEVLRRVREKSRVPIRDEAINVFMGLPEDGAEPRLELTYNIGPGQPYEIGTGYGHIAITTADLDDTLSKLTARGIEPERPPYTVREGGSRLCFVRDPDGYRIELIERPL